MISVFVNIANTAGNTLTNQLCVNTEDGWKSLDHRNIIPTEYLFCPSTYTVLDCGCREDRTTFLILNQNLFNMQIYFSQYRS